MVVSGGSVCRDCNRARAKAWRAENADHFRAVVRAWWARGGEKVAATKAKMRLAKKARNAAVRRGRLTPDDVGRILAGQKGKCAYCRCKLETAGPRKYHLDHIVPLAAGGAHEAANLQAACPSCNISKGAKDPIDFAQSLGRLL